MDVIDRIGPERAWLATLLLGVVGFAGGSYVAPKQVYDGFIWRYFWGPVYADAQKAQCAIREGGSVSLSRDATACAAAPDSAIVATPGYTAVSEVGYMIVGLFFVVGIFLLLKRLHLGRYREMFFALVPFMLFGGALRVVEDANDAIIVSEGEPFLSYPVNTLFISPIIYFTVFGITLAALLLSVSLSRRDVVESYPRLLGIIGTVALVVTIAWLVIVSVLRDVIEFHPVFFVLTVGIASALAYGLYWLFEQVGPDVNDGTGYIGIVVLWSHAIDGVANVLASDWATSLGLPFNYTPKHPANQIIIDITQSVLPAGVAAVIGTAWPFLLVKLVVAVAIVWLFTEEFIEESPRYSIVLLMSISAVGLGPGTRDMIRATFGI